MNKQKKDLTKCFSCEEEFDLNEDENYEQDGDKFYCGNCSESKWESAGTIAVYNGELNGHSKIAAWGDPIDEGNVDGENLIKLFGRPVWRSLSAWRGYYEFEKTPAGLTKIADGWITSYIDETTKYKQKAVDVYEELENAKKAGESLPFTIYWTFCNTSNVFSTASDVWIDKVDVFKAWLKERLNLSVEDLDNAFN